MRGQLCLLALLAAATACGEPAPPAGLSPLGETVDAPAPPVIPLPASFTWNTDAWPADARVAELLADPSSVDAAELNRVGVALTIGGDGEPESYTLIVTQGGATIFAADSAGLFYGLQTLRQLVEAGSPVRGIRIDDAPRFPYRGMHLDVARHFMPVAFVKRYIDLLARQKMNVFHWHLTDDQGWRIEIRRYPLLTEVGGCRRETMVTWHFDPYIGDGIPHCGFYTQAEIRDVVAYAARRHVTIVPEIEMPGHARAALAAYPELACTTGPFEVRTTWGIDEDVFCPSEQTFEFIDGVLTEVARLFPGPWIHIGGDEVPKVRWNESALAQELMARENLEDADALQRWFTNRVERIVRAKGKRMIGWDEILEDGLAPGATVMSWRGTDGGVEAASAGHDVIMSPTSHLYFDYYQGDARQEPLAIGGFVPLEQVYAFEPVPEELSEQAARHILGAQANVWTEYLATPEAVEYMAYPRALALAEVLWSPRESRSWSGFTARLPSALRSLDRLGVAYRLPDVQGLATDRLTLDDSVTIELSTAIPDGVIRYTTDGSTPSLESAPYRAPIALPVDDRGVRVTARAFAPDGRASAVRAATFTRTTLVAPLAVDSATLASGLRYEYFELTAERVAALDTAQAVRSGAVDAFERRGDERPEHFGLRFSGHVHVPASGLYEFSLTSDDGATLEIAGRVVVDNDGYHGPEERSGMIALASGWHPIVLRYAQASGGATLRLLMRRENEAWQPVPASWLRHAPDAR